MSLGPYWVGDVPTDAVVVTITRNGQTVDLSGYTGASIELTDPDGLAVDVSAASVEISSGSAVTFNWPFVPTLFSKAGLYTVQVILETNQGSERAALIPVEVRGAVADAVATPHDVLRITGQVVDADDIERAYNVIDTFTGVSDLAVISDRDAKYLQRAVAYQTVFMLEQPDLFSRHDMVDVTQDTLRYNTRDATSLVLAPLAKTALGRCSWAGSRTKTVRPSRILWVGK